MAISIDQQQHWLPSDIGDTPTSKVAQRTPSQELALSSPAEDGENDAFSFFGDDGFSFGDLLDIVNPLQHIPLISTFYRETTGDQISAGPRVMGSTLFFGPIGLAGALANVVVEENTGMDIGQHMASWTAPEEDNLANEEKNATNPSAPENILDANDPVIAWARQEADWVKQGAKSPAPTPKAKSNDITLPDAERWVQQEQPWAATSDQLTNTAMINAQARAASLAYEAAAGLELSSRG